MRKHGGHPDAGRSEQVAAYILSATVRRRYAWMMNHCPPRATPRSALSRRLRRPFVASPR